MRVLVLGASGQVARALQAASGDVVARGRPHTDVLQADAVARAIVETAPDLVLNCAAFTAVDAAEDKPNEAYDVNEKGAACVASVAARHRLPLIHLSTDYVFDGSKASPYDEDDIPSPCNVYGMSKLAGERAVHDRYPEALVLRTAWIYSGVGQNFLLTILGLASRQQEISVVQDQVGCPTFADDLASGILSLAQSWVRNADRLQDQVLHMASPQSTTRFEWARDIFALSRTLGGPYAVVNPIETASFKAKAIRPLNSALSSQRLDSEYGIRLPLWRDSLARCMSGLARNGWGQR